MDSPEKLLALLSTKQADIRSTIVSNKRAYDRYLLDNVAGIDNLEGLKKQLICLTSQKDAAQTSFNAAQTRLNDFVLHQGTPHAYIITTINFICYPSYTIPTILGIVFSRRGSSNSP